MDRTVPTTREFVQYLGPAVTRARTSRQITCDTLADTLYVSKMHLKNIEHGRKAPSLPLLLDLLTSLDISMDALLSCCR